MASALKTFFSKHLFIFHFIWLHWVLVVAYEIWFPEKGLNLGSLIWQHWNFSPWTTREIPASSFCLLFASVLCVVAQSCPAFCNPGDCSLPGTSVGFSRWEYWSGLPCPPPTGLPDPGIEPVSLSPSWLYFVEILSVTITMNWGKSTETLHCFLEVNSGI